MRAAYAAASVVSVPSLYLDPFPTINLEAHASQRAVVGTCFGGTPECVQDERTGFIVNPYDEQKHAEKLSLLLTDTKLARRMGEAGRTMVQERFSLTRYADECERIFARSLVPNKVN